MSLFSGNIFSRSLVMDTQIFACLPQDGRKYKKGPPPKTLFLLHGISGNAANFVHNTPVHFYSQQYGIAIIMPEVQRSFYQDMKGGLLYYSYITKELPALCAELFNISVTRENLSIAGLSMGGYGAMYAAFSAPEVFSACGAFAPACDIKSQVASYNRYAGFGQVGYRMEHEFAGIFGEDFAVPDSIDLYRLSGKVSRESLKPRLYIGTGTEDPLHDQSVKFRDHVQKLDIDMIYEEWPGDHDWIFGNEALKRMLAHFYSAAN
ncbi:MAG: esterase family protein [Treponema sp.]|jgi:S-formylglutathione hydrolase FrmB|nr:esterase family protein [Treponema sp.]